MNMDNNGRGPGFFPGPAFDAHHGGHGTALGWVIFALQLLMLAALAVLLVRAFAPRPAWRRPRTATTADDPLDHLRWRYARGEITRDEYLQAASDLGGELPAN